MAQVIDVTRWKRDVRASITTELVLFGICFVALTLVSARYDLFGFGYGRPDVFSIMGVLAIGAAAATLSVVVLCCLFVLLIITMAIHTFFKGPPPPVRPEYFSDGVDSSYYEPVLRETVGNIISMLQNWSEKDIPSYRLPWYRLPPISLLYLAGSILSISAIVGSMYFNEHRFSSPETYPISSKIHYLITWISAGRFGPLKIRIFFVLNVAICAFLLNLFIRSLAKKAKNIMEEDGRPPILWLRSFDDDNLGRPGEVSFLWRALVKETFEFGPRKETGIIDHFKPFGPVVAIGRPTELEPELGAARFYFCHDEWQGKALELMERSRLIVMVLGETNGLAWELSRIAEKEFLNKTLFLMLHEDDLELTNDLENFSRLYSRFSSSGGFSLHYEDVKDAGIRAFYIKDGSTIAIGGEKSNDDGFDEVDSLIYYAALYGILFESDS